MENAPINLNVQWMINPQSVPTPANNLLIIEGIGVSGGPPATFELHFGHVSAPAIFADTPEQMAEMAASATALVNSVGHYSVPIDAMRQMYETMGEALRKYDANRR